MPRPPFPKNVREFQRQFATEEACQQYGLGGGPSASVLFDSLPTSAVSAVRPVDTAGGWSQLKVTATPRLEFNVAFGGDASLKSGRHRSAANQREFMVTRNASGFVNGIYQARSNLFFSLEYRRLGTMTVDGDRDTADHVSVSTGIVF